MEKEYVKITIYDYASRRTKNRFSKFANKIHRIEIINKKNNESLSGDGFVKGEPMTYFGIDTLGDDDVWSRAWEGWIPDSEYEILDDKVRCDFCNKQINRCDALFIQRRGVHFEDDEPLIRCADNCKNN